MHIRIDPVGGLAGDMFVAAMLDAFPPLEASVRDAVRAAGLPERFRCDLVPHADHALTGRRFLVVETTPSDPHGHAHDHPHQHAHEHAHDHEHGHRPFAEIRGGLNAAPLDPGVRDHALAIFTALAEAEAQVHGATTDTVSFHELGEWDSIADIVAAAAIIHALGPATWSVGALPLGSGFVKSAHGLLPVPAPATTLLLRGLDVRDDGVPGERVTPTGAAIARHLTSLPGSAPRERRLLGTGLGFGTRSLPGISNCVRVLVFDAALGDAATGDHVTSIEFEIDDQTPEDLAIGLDRVRAHAGVLDVLQTPAIGKKGRVVVSVRVLCRASAEDEVAQLCFLETTTLGLRLRDVRRHTLSRASSTVDVEGRAIDRKRADRGAHSTTKVEAESLRDVAGHEARERLRRAALRD
ncbi:MAG: LarC family nickel insertion protein [Vicinamibacteria bacterium]|nr:LarC family nickel insertion protein [Vicinamibacteria bacterium]